MSFLNIIIYILSFIVTFKVIMLLLCSIIHYNMKDRKEESDVFFSVLVPCYNEELTLTNCIESLINQTYKKFEIIIIDDGSKDKTFDIANQLKSNYSNINIEVFKKENGGKASALNFGIEKAKGDIIVSLDADSIFLENTLSQISQAFLDKNLVAVCGNVKISNRDKILTKCQAMEYITGLNIQRRAFAFLNAIHVVAGAIGAFRKDKVIEVGGYSHDTLVEDMDLTISLSSKGYKIKYLGDAIAYTEAPETLTNLYKQRYRWYYGFFQIIRKYNKLIFKDFNNNLFMILFPYVIFFTIIDTIMLILIISLPLLIFLKLITISELIPLILLVSIMEFLIYLMSAIIDNENKKLIYIMPIFLIYTQLLNLIVLKTFIDNVRNKKSTWNKFERLGKNTIN